jgi:hypothetical protein
MHPFARHLAACGAGLALGAAGLVLVPGPSRVLAAAVLGLAGALALWPMPAGQGSRETAARVGELEAEVARLTETLARRDDEIGRLAGALIAIHRLLETDAGAPAGAEPAEPRHATGPRATPGGRERATEEDHHGAERNHRERAAA